MTKPNSDFVSARCRSCGRVFGKVSFQDWQQDIKSLHGVVCAKCGSRADAREAKPV
jgi:DNA-directed RNA polymerase subunit RPC12/RpoP